MSSDHPPCRTPAPRGGRTSRRDLLRLGMLSLGALAVPGPAWALGRSSSLVFGMLDHGPEPDPRPTALRRLAWEVVKRTSIEAELETAVLPPTSEELFFHPFLVLAGSQELPPLSEAGAAALRRHLTYGGTLLVDRTEGEEGGPFDRSVRRLLDQVLPGRPLGRIPRDHVLFKSFYLLDEPGGRQLRRPWMEGIALDDRFAVVYSHNDLLGAWARDDLGLWRFDVDPRQREMAFRTGVNLVMYAMCLDYKDDQVHLPFILKRRKS